MTNVNLEQPVEEAQQELPEPTIEELEEEWAALGCDCEWG